jgi:putative ABC transport system permease protein
MGITVLKGRSFTGQDTPNSQPVAMVNETMARKHWPEGDALGKRFRVDGPLAENPWRTIVGIIRDVKHELFSPVIPEYYFPAAQDPWSTMILVAQTNTEPLALAAAVRNAVVSLDKDQPVFDVRTMEQVRAQSVLPFSFSGVLLSIFAMVALVLAAVGIYGVMSYLVSQRTHEIGVRMALGARRSDVLKMIIRHGMALTAIGLGIGSLGAWFLMRAMTAMLIEVSANDLSIFVGVPVVLALVALFACFIPARRATKIDPMIALRYE